MVDALVNVAAAFCVFFMALWLWTRANLCHAERMVKIIRRWADDDAAQIVALESENAALAATLRRAEAARAKDLERFRLYVRGEAEAAERAAAISSGRFAVIARDARSRADEFLMFAEKGCGCGQAGGEPGTCDPGGQDRPGAAGPGDHAGGPAAPAG